MRGIKITIAVSLWLATAFVGFKVGAFFGEQRASNDCSKHIYKLHEAHQAELEKLRMELQKAKAKPETE